MTDYKRFEGETDEELIYRITGEKEFGYVQLQNVWRSRIAELTDKF